MKLGKNILGVLLLVTGIAISMGCGHKEDKPVAQSLIDPNSGFQRVKIVGGAHGPIEMISYHPEEIDSLLSLPPSARPQDPIEALRGIMTFPRPQIEVSPISVPPTQMAIASQTDTSAVITYIAEHSYMGISATLEKKQKGSSSVWIVTRLEQLGPHPPK